MSGYLTFYIKIKGNEKPVSFLSYSRSTDIYQAFNEHNIIYCGDDDDKYTEITEKLLDDITKDLKETIDKSNKKVSMIKANLPEKSEERLEMINEIISWEEYLEDTKQTLNSISIFYDMLDYMKYSSEIEKLLCNIY